MTHKAIPRRRFIIDVDGKQYRAKELSMEFLSQMTDDGSDDTEQAIKDSIGDIDDKDLVHFGIETKSLIHIEILKFTFQDVLTQKDIAEIRETFHLTDQEIGALTIQSKEQLKGIIASRKPRDRDAEKKD